MAIECLVLGAGQEVGKSCVVVTVGGKKIMFDCGMHMGRPDDPYPDFSRISPNSDFDSVLSCVVITHFHLDHSDCGLHLYPTKALAPLMLEDYRKVMVDRRGENQQFTHEHIANCMNKVITLDVKQTVQVDKDLQIRAYYAGHVLGAVMLYAKAGDNSLVYTGDYNMTPDRHLGAAHIDKLQLDMLVTESTYATTIRDSKYTREREFLKVVHECVNRGGKVLIPTFAMGRAQELCLLLEDYWERMSLNVPIYFSAGLTIQANMYYKMFVSWTSQNIKDSYGLRNAFDFRHVLPFDRTMVDAPGPCVLFATPGMLTGGFSVEVFKHWAPSERNLVTLPGFCLAGTLGHKLMSGKTTKVDLDEGNHIDVRCQIHQLSFSPHTDAKGIMDLVRFLSPKNVVLVHGEKPNMEKLKHKIQSELEIQCYIPANNEIVIVQTSQTVKIDASRVFLRQSSPHFDKNSVTKTIAESHSGDMKLVQSPVLRDEKFVEGVLVMDKTKRAKLVLEDELLQMLNKEKHELKFCYCCPVDSGKLAEKESSSETDYRWLHLLRNKLENVLGGRIIQEGSDHLSFGSLQVRLCGDEDCPFRKSKEANSSETPPVFFCCSWSLSDEQMARRILTSMHCLGNQSHMPIQYEVCTNYLNRCIMRSSS